MLRSVRAQWSPEASGQHLDREHDQRDPEDDPEPDQQRPGERCSHIPCGRVLLAVGAADRLALLVPRGLPLVRPRLLPVTHDDSFWLSGTAAYPTGPAVCGLPPRSRAGIALPRTRRGVGAEDVLDMVEDQGLRRGIEPTVAHPVILHRQVLAEKW